ncbi:MAG: GAF domain-containing protein [Gemmatimonadota bacterium]
MPHDPTVLPPTEKELREELERLRLLHRISQDFNSSLEMDELLPRVFDTVLTAVGAQGGSIWIAEGEVLRCRVAMGSSSQKLVDTTVPIESGFVGDVVRRQRTTMVTRAMEDPRFDQRIERSSQMVTLTVMATPMVTKGHIVGSIQLVNKVTKDGIFDEQDRELLEGIAELAAVALHNARLHDAEKRANDLAMLLEISREITSTLDIDRVLHTVVNLAARAFTFDRAAIALVDRNRWEIRAVAGEETVKPDAPELKRLAERGAWAADQAATIYLADIENPGGAAGSVFFNIYEPELREEGLSSVLYLPLRDDQGLLGALLMESRSPNLVTPSQLEQGQILANQTSVALRNAQLYHLVPLADTWGIFAARKQRFLALPRRRKLLYIGGGLLLLAAFTLIRWPLRVAGDSATFRAGHLTEVRAPVPGMITRVMVREGNNVNRGQQLVQLRDPSLEADREARVADVLGADREAVRAAANGDAAEEQIQRARLGGLEQELRILDQQVAALSVRAPSSGVVLTARPEELEGRGIRSGDPLITIGRTDTVTLEFGVEQRDIERIQTGQTTRLRIAALPGRTFEGRVVSLGLLPMDSGPNVQFPVRVDVANPGEELRPGMAADVRVLTQPASLATRVFRGPSRWLRLFWWRIRP